MTHTRIVRWCVLMVALCLPALVAAAPERLDVDQIAFAQAQVFDEGAGLTDLTATAISASPEGYVWVGTMRGVSRFNGHRMVPVPGPDGVLNKPIRDLIALPDGTVWVATGQNGLQRLRNGVWEKIDTAFGLTTPNVVRLRAFNGPNGTRLFATGRFMVAEWDGKRWKTRTLPEELRELEIRDVLPAAGPRGEVLWFGSYGKGLYRCEGMAPCEPVQIPLPGERFYEITALGMAIEADGSRSIWAGADGGGLARMHDGAWQRVTPRNSDLPGDSVLALQVVNMIDQEPQVWVGLRGGLARLRRGHWEHMDYVGMWASGRISALHAARDAHGRTQMWVGSDSGAVRMRLQDDWRIVSLAGKGRAGIWALRYEKDTQGERLWLGTDGEGLLRYQHQEWKSFGTADGLPDKTVRSLARVPVGGNRADELWVGTWRGHLARYDGTRFQVMPTPWPKREDEAVSAILPVAPGDVWVALRTGGVAHLSDGTWHWFDAALKSNPAKVLGMLRTGSGKDATIWTSTFGQGLASYRHGTWRFFGKSEGLPDDNYTGLSLIPGADGKPLLWVGSLSNGVVRLDIADPDQPRVVTTPVLPPLPDNYVYGALRDANGDTIVCTNYGVARWKLVPGDGYKSLVYHRTDGLPHDECNAGAMQRDDYGRIWIGTIGGAAVYLPQAAALRGRVAPLLLERAQVDGVDRTADFQAGKPLVGNFANLSVQFTLLTGERESLNQYRSQLEPLEKEPGQWGEGNTRSFTGLPAGKYRLRVEARDYTGTASRPLVLEFSIPTPWWRSLPAIIGGVVLLLLLVWGWTRWHERAARRREKNLVKLIRERTTELERRGDELGRMNEELTRLSYRDQLTDLANRRMLVKHLEDEWEIGALSGTRLAFLLFDLDQFKSYNDIYGHLAGDDCLRQIARRIQAELRKSDDSAGRYGGEEFGVVLPGLSLEHALIVAERIRSAVERAALPHKGGQNGIVTISVGAASIIPTEGGHPDALIAAADKALYRAKQAGRNRVES